MTLLLLFVSVVESHGKAWKDWIAYYRIILIVQKIFGITQKLVAPTVASASKFELFGIRWGAFYNFRVMAHGALPSVLTTRRYWYPGKESRRCQMSCKNCRGLGSVFHILAIVVVGERGTGEEHEGLPP